MNTFQMTFIVHFKKYLWKSILDKSYGYSALSKEFLNTKGWTGWTEYLKEDYLISSVSLGPDHNIDFVQ